MKKSIFTLSSALAFVLLQSSAWAIPSELAKLDQELSPKMETLLQTEHKRSKIGFEITPEQKEKVKCDKCGVYDLKVPDHVKRDTIFNLRLSYKTATPVLQGEVYSSSQKNLVTQIAKQSFPQGIQINITSFPYPHIAKDYAVSVKASNDLYVKPIKQAGENLATQVRLGTPLEVLALDPSQKFALVRIHDDGYIAWIARENLREMDEAEYKTWRDQRQVLLMKEVAGSPTLYFGTRLKLVEKKGTQVIAALPSGQKVTLNQDDVTLQLPQTPSPEQILKVARYFLPQGMQGGGTYLWGGSLGKRLDCSGFVQTVFRVNNVYLPRDADQQKSFTRPVGNTLKELSELQPGDLVFFSGHRKWPTHVGIYIGQNQIIHSSAKGQYDGIKINTLKGGGEYDKYLQSIYFGGGRVTRSL